MARYRADTLHDLRNVLAARAGHCALYSFDIFDTLLGRRIDPPEIVHETLCARVAERLDADLTPAQILGARRTAEAHLRGKATAAGFDHECRYRDLLSLWVRRLVGHEDEDLAGWIADREMELEIDALEVKEGAVSLLRELNATGKRVIAASDMYLGRKELERLLQAKGLTGFFHEIYVSSETLRCKYSGKLFRDILDEQHVKPEEMVHTGDNRVSDVKVPAALGIHAVYLRESAERKRRGILTRYGRLAEKQNYWRGRYLLQVIGDRPGRERPAHQRNADYRYGFDVLGPIFSVFIHGVVRRLESEDIGNVYFLARDGFLLQRLFENMAPALAPRLAQRVRPQYLHLSRQSTAPATLADGMTHEQAALALNNPKQRGLQSILKAFSLPVEAFRDTAARHGFVPIDAPITDRRDPRLHAFLNDDDVKAVISEHGRLHRDLLGRYVNEYNFFNGGSAAFVDIGWNGTIQHFMNTAFGHMPTYPAVYGLYFAFCMGIPYRFGEKDRIEGIFYDERRGFSTERMVMNFEEIFEESSRATHATTIGYRRNGDGRVEPVLKGDDSPDRQAEMTFHDAIEGMQKGILDFADEYLRAVRLTNYDFDDIKPFVVTLMERAVGFPRKAEIARLSGLVHSEDWGHDNILDVQSEPSGGFWRNPIKAVKASDWPYGLVTEKTGVLGASIFRYLHLLRKG